MGERNRGVTVFSVVLVIVGVVGAVAVAMYVSRQHSYRTLLLVAAVSFCFTAVVAAGLFLNRKRSAALAMLAVGAGAEFMAARAIVRYRRDYDFVQPRPLAAARHIRAKTNETPKAPAPVAVEVNAAAAATSPPAIKREIPKKAADLLTATPFDFPQFLGRNRSASVQGVHVEREWSQHSPKLLWRQHIAPAWSAFAIVNGYAVTMEQRGNEETVACYELATGQPVWATSVRARYENPDWHEAGVGPRSTPTIDEGKVYTLGAMGHLLCLNGSDGKPIWQKDLLAEYGITPEQEKSDIPFGRANSPLVVKDLVIVPAGGAPGRRISLAAFNKRTGKKIWESGTRQIGYSSPALATLAGTPQVLSVNEDTVSGHDPDTGKLLWEQAWPGESTGPVKLEVKMHSYLRSGA